MVAIAKSRSGAPCQSAQGQGATGVGQPTFRHGRIGLDGRVGRCYNDRRIERCLTKVGGVGSGRFDAYHGVREAHRAVVNGRRRRRPGIRRVDCAHRRAQRRQLQRVRVNHRGQVAPSQPAAFTAPSFVYCAVEPSVPTHPLAPPSRARGRPPDDVLQSAVPDPRRRAARATGIDW
jgi:hypothetical protein